MREKILIITASDEPNVPDVLGHLTGEKVVRINTDSLSNLTSSLRIEQGEITATLSSGQQVAASNEVKSIWYRRPPLASVQEDSFSELDRKFVESENQRFFRALWNSFPSEGTVWVNYPLATHRVEHNKPLQLQTACQSGMNTPETLITNDFVEAREFLRSQRGRIILKTFSSYSRDENGWPVGVYTTPINEQQLEEFGHELRYAPVIFQQYVPKKFELRVTVVGKRIFACAIYSQDSPRTKDDWRRYDFKNVKHKPYQLPPTVKKAILSCMRSWGLQFGAIDMIVTPEEDYVFLEVNPSGHWGWIESLTGLPISRAIAELLANPKELAR